MIFKISEDSLEGHQVRHHQIERGQYHSKPAKRDSGDKSDNDHKLTAKATAALGRRWETLIKLIKYPSQIPVLVELRTCGLTRELTNLKKTEQFFSLRNRPKY